MKHKQAFFYSIGLILIIGFIMFAFISESIVFASRNSSTMKLLISHIIMFQAEFGVILLNAGLAALLTLSYRRFKNNAAKPPHRWITLASAVLISIATFIYIYSLFRLGSNIRLFSVAQPVALLLPPIVFVLTIFGHIAFGKLYAIKK